MNCKFSFHTFNFFLKAKDNGQNILAFDRTKFLKTKKMRPLN